MNIKSLVLALGLSLPLLALAAADKPAGKNASARKPAASAPASAAQPSANRNVGATALQRNRSRGAAMGACTKKAADQNLQDVERKQFIARCMNGQ